MLFHQPPTESPPFPSPHTHPLTASFSQLTWLSLSGHWPAQNHSRTSSMIYFFRSLWLPWLNVILFTSVSVNRVHFRNDHISLSLINYVFYTLKICFKIILPIWYQSPFKQLVSELHLLSIIPKQSRRVRSLRRQNSFLLQLQSSGLRIQTCSTGQKTVRM